EEYIEDYLQLHRKVRLTAAGDKKKKNLMNDARLKELNSLAAIELLPHQGLVSFMDNLAGIKTCFNLTEGDLETSPICTHCDFKPISEKCDIEVDHLLSQMDARLDTLHSAWIQTLLNNLQDPTVQQNFELLKDDQKEVVETFLSTKSLPEKVEGVFIETVQQLLSGLFKIPVKIDELQDALFTDGSPLQPEELEERFHAFVQDKLSGKEQRKVRFVLE
ncbi:MAG: DUF6079 family protein, partial [Spirochaetota bacterium]|nr:DUF6079 family protein [Spirochaetota bacterium]